MAYKRSLIPDWLQVVYNFSRWKKKRKDKTKELLDFIDFYQQWASFFRSHSNTIWKWKKSESVSHSAMSDFLKPHGLKLIRLLCPGKRILQARILEWVAISFSRGSSQPRDWTLVSCIEGRFFTIWATREAHNTIWLNFFITWTSFLETWRGADVCVGVYVCVCVCVETKFSLQTSDLGIMNVSTYSFMRALDKPFMFLIFWEWL